MRGLGATYKNAAARVMVLALLSSSVQAESSAAAQTTDTPKSLPHEVVQAWATAGAQARWMRLEGFGRYRVLFADGPKPDDLPAFFWSAPWKEGVLSKLPAPAMPFGLHISGVITDAGLRELAGFRTLRALIAGSPNVTNASMNDLAALKHLHYLSLSGAKVTGTGLKELAGSTSLQVLDLAGTEVTDVDLNGVGEIKSLEALSLVGTKVTGSGFKELAGLKKLRYLGLGRTNVTDAGLQGLTELKGLRELYLGSKEITDAGIKELAKLQSLERLDLECPRLTVLAAFQLQAALPKCQVRRF